MRITEFRWTGSGIKTSTETVRLGGYQIKVRVRNAAGPVTEYDAVITAGPNRDRWQVDHVDVAGMANGAPLTIEALLMGTVTESEVTSGGCSDASFEDVRLNESASRGVIVDLDSPQVRIQHSEILTSPESVLIVGTTTEDLGVKSVQWLLDGITSGEAVSTDDWSTWTADVPLPNLSQRHAVTISATDNTGNVASTSLPAVVAFTSPTTDTTQPFIVPWNVDGVTFEFAGVATGGASALQMVEFALNRDPSDPENERLFQPAERVANDWSSWRAAVELDRPGNHSVTVRAQDEHQKSELVILNLIAQEVVDDNS
jgi:hypothetical protein